jgi:archaellum biogenesis ATPase FlaH
MKHNFTEDDKKKVIDFLNAIATKASFNEMNVQDVISFFKLLSHMQTVILPKIDANILEVIRVVEAKEESK